MNERRFIQSLQQTFYFYSIFSIDFSTQFCLAGSTEVAVSRESRINARLRVGVPGPAVAAVIDLGGECAVAVRVKAPVVPVAVTRVGQGLHVLGTSAGQAASWEKIEVISWRIFRLQNSNFI